MQYSVFTPRNEDYGSRFELWVGTFHGLVWSQERCHIVSNPLSTKSYIRLMVVYFTIRMGELKPVRVKPKMKASYRDLNRRKQQQLDQFLVNRRIEEFEDE